MDNELKRVLIPGNLGITAAKIVALLEQGKMGDVLTDEQLTDECGKDTSVNGKGYAALATAIRHVRRTKGLVWKRVKGAKAIKCLGSQEILTVLDSHRQHIGRSAKSALQKAACAKLNEIPQQDRSRFLATTAQLGTLSIFANRDTQKQLEARGITDAIDARKMLRMFEK